MNKILRLFFTTCFFIYANAMEDSYEVIACSEAQQIITHVQEYQDIPFNITNLLYSWVHTDTCIFKPTHSGYFTAYYKAMVKKEGSLISQDTITIALKKNNTLIPGSEEMIHLYPNKPATIDKTCLFQAREQDQIKVCIQASARNVRIIPQFAGSTSALLQIKFCGPKRATI
jgi:hypothetical protein